MLATPASETELTGRHVKITHMAQAGRTHAAKKDHKNDGHMLVTTLTRTDTKTALPMEKKVWLSCTNVNSG